MPSHVAARGATHDRRETIKARERVASLLGGGKATSPKRAKFFFLTPFGHALSLIAAAHNDERMSTTR